MTPVKLVAFSTVAFMIHYIHSCVGTIEHTERNISCSDIKTTQGFKFLHKCPDGANISALFNKTLIAALTNGKAEFMPALVKSVDSSSITTFDCRDLQIKCLIFYVELVEEEWVIFTVTEEIKVREPDSPTPYGLWISVGTVAVIIMGILVGCCCRYRCWRNNMMKQQRKATVLGFLTACCRKRKSQTETVDLSCVTTTASDSQESGENGPVQNGTAVVHSGDTNAHVNRAMKRKDFWVEKDHNSVMVTGARSGCVRGDRGGEDREAESSLLPNERANIQDPDMAGEAEAFVKKSVFDPGPVSRCFAAPNSDVESPSQDEETQYK